MSAFRFLLCLFLLLLSSASFGFDWDADGLPNNWEDANGLNKFNKYDAESDFDNDGLTALEEFYLGTSPNKNDTDDDGVNDSIDNCVLERNADQSDTNDDLVGDACDDDDDKDSLPDSFEIEMGRDSKKKDYMISTRTTFTCAISDHGVECWGNNPHNIQDPPQFNNPRQIGVGWYHACVLDETLTGPEVVCWGNNWNGETSVPNLSNPKQISVGSQSSCAIDDDGVKCWGWNGNGETLVPDLSNPIKITSGSQTHCALDDFGVTCWGWNGNGEASPPAEVLKPELIAGGVFSSCAIQDSIPICWGLMGGYWTSPPELDRPFDLGVGNNFACALDQQGLKCWGWETIDLQPLTPNLSNPVSISVGEKHVCALHDFGYECWGQNDNGQTSVPSEIYLDADFDSITSQFGLDDKPYDTDNDGTENIIDTDDDGDGVSDTADAFPLNSAESLDTDGDGIGNNVDIDDDGDGVNDVLDLFPLYDQFNSSMTWDFDEDGNADALTDGLLLMRYLFELRGTSLTEAAIAENSAVSTQKVEQNVAASAISFADIDGDGNVDALTDGLLLLRYLFELRGTALTEMAIAENASRSSASVVHIYINSFMPYQNPADSNGDSFVDLNTELLNYTTTSSGGVYINGVAQRNNVFGTQIINNTGKDLLLKRVEFFENGNLDASANGVDLIDNGVHRDGQTLSISYTVGRYGALSPVTVNYIYEFQGTIFVKTFTVAEF